MAKVIIPFVILFLLIPIILANDLEVSLVPHYYLKGHEIISTPEIQYSAISFEIIGKNSNEKYRILNLSIVDSYPPSFEKALPKDIIIDMLRIKQTKTLFVSQLIDINDLKQFNQTNISLWVGIEGISEETGKMIYSEGYYNLELQKPSTKKHGFLILLGEYIWEGNPNAGIGVALVLIFCIGFAFWKHEWGNKLNKWREESERKRKIKEKYEEGW